MSDELTLEALATEIRQRLDAVQNSVDERLTGAEEKVSDAISDEKLKEMIRSSLPDLLDDEEFGEEIRRKMRFAGGDTDREVVGTKYARWGLSLADVEWLHDIQSGLAGQRRVNGAGVYTGPSEELSRTFEAITEAYYLPADKVREIDRKAIDDLFPRLPLDAFHGKDRELAKKGKYELTGAYQRAVRAMDTAESGFGQQLIGAQYVSELWEAPRKLGRVFPLIDSFEMTDPTAFLPVEVDIPEMLFVGESTAPYQPALGSGSNEYPTRKTGSQRVQVDARKFVIHQQWSGEMEEDSIIAFVPFLRRQAARSIAHYSDSLVVNGDTTSGATGNINSDDGAPAATRHYLAFDGLRHAFLVDNTANGIDVAGGAVTLALLNQLRGRMIDETNLVDWGHPTDPDDLVFFSDPITADRVALLDEYVTLDKYGPQATVFNGEAGRILGHRHISTIALPRTEADGKVSTTPANNTQGQLFAANFMGAKVGWRRRVMVETERLPATDQTRIVYSLRLGFGRFTPTGASSGIESASGLFNINV